MKKSKLVGWYLYEDSHAVLVYEQTVKLGGSDTAVEYVVVHERFTEAQISFKGRLCFQRYGGEAFLDLCKKAHRIEATPASISNGSENCKRDGIRVGGLTIEFKDGTYLHWTTFPDLISDRFTYQPETVEKFDAGDMHWCNYKIAETIRVKQPKQLAAVA